MITLAYLKGNPMLDKAIKQPTTFDKAGYYPTRYGVTTHADGSLDVLLGTMTKR